MSYTNPQVGAVSLGCIGITASWRRHPENKSIDWSQVCIQCAGFSEDGVYTPAESVIISGRAALLSLRGAIDEALKEPELTEPPAAP